MNDYDAHAWTLSPGVARKFARRFTEGGNSRPVLEVTIGQTELLDKALFYTNKRSEDEVFFEQDPRR